MRTPALHLCFSVLIMVFASLARASEFAEPWSWVAPKPQGNQLTASAYDPQRDLTVVVGEYGTVMTRTGRGAWQVQQVRAGGRFSCITWTGKVFVAGSESGGLFRSLDGVAWSRIKFGQFNDGPNSPPSSSGYWSALNGDQVISAIASSESGITVALAQDAVWVSSDEERRTWKKTTLPKGSSNSWPYYSDLIHGKGLFVAVGQQGSIATSANGTSWTTRTSGIRRDFNSVAFNGNFFVAMAPDYTSTSGTMSVLRSSNGTTWGAVEPVWPKSDWNDQGNTAERALAAGAQFVMDAYNDFYVSGDYVNWTKVSKSDQYPVSNIFTSSIVQGVGPTTGNRTLIFCRPGQVDSLDSAATLVESEIPYTGLYYGGFVGGVDDLLVGANWAETSWSARHGEPGQFVEGAVYPPRSIFQQRGFLVGISRNYSEPGYPASFKLLQRQPDGSGKWVNKGSGELSGEVIDLAAASLLGPVVCMTRTEEWDEEQWTSTDHLYYSPDWNTWELLSSHTTNPQYPPAVQVDHDGQKFVMISPEGRIRHSANGRVWAESDLLPALPDDTEEFRRRFHGNDASIPKTNRPVALASNGDRLVVTAQKERRFRDGETYPAASVDGRFFVWDFKSNTPGWREFVAPWASIPDGITWWYDERRPGTMVWNGTRFIRLPQELSPAREPQAGRLFASTDGEQWTQHEMPTAAVRIAWTGSQFVAVTIEGAVLTHPDGLSPEIVSSLRILNQPASVAAYNGESVTFEVVAQTDLPGLAYQWFKDDKAIKGATKSFLTIKCSSSTIGRYHVVLTAAEGAREVSVSAFLTLRPAATWAWQDGGSGDRVITAKSGARVELALTNVQGPGQITYQWLRDGKAIKGATGAKLVIDSASLSNAGVYSVVITTTAGKVTTEMLRLVVEDTSALVYSLTGKAELRRSVGATVPSGKIAGHMIVDRSASNPRAAFIWIESVGKQSFYRTEEFEDAVMHSTGPGPGTTSVVSRFSSGGDYPRENRQLLWIAGTDSLVKLNSTANTLAPANMSGWVNTIEHSQAGTSFYTVSVSLTLDKTRSANARSLGFAGALAAIKSELEGKGIFPAAR